MSPGPVVVAVLSHRDPPLVRRLVARVLEGERTVALVHHDPRSEPHGLARHDRVLTVPDPEPCDWGRPALARAVLRCLDEAVSAVPDLSWVLLVSGQDYPVQHLRHTERELDELAIRGVDALLRWYPVSLDGVGDVHPWQARCRARYLHRRRLPGSHRSVPFPRRAPFDDQLRLHIGDMWANLAAPAVHHVLRQRAALPHVETYLSRCSVADEALLPTLLLHDADHLQILPERRRYIRWVEGHPSPEQLTPEDVAAIRGQAQGLGQGRGDWFARKVDRATHPEVLDLLDAEAGAHVDHH